MPRGIYDRSTSKPRPRKSDKPQASTGKAAKLLKKPAVKRAPRKARATSIDGSLAAYVPIHKTAEQTQQDRAMVDDLLAHFPRGELQTTRCAVEVSPNVYGWLAINAKARGIGPDTLLEELVMRHIQLGLS